MSRWMASFENHAFQATWSELKSNLESATVDDETVITSVQEIARLKKVIIYIDELIKGIDPEIVPLTTWDNFQAQAIPCNQNIVEYNNNRNIAHITKANSHADNLLSYVRPYMVLPDSVARSLQESINAYVNTINSHSQGFVDKATEIVSEIENNKTKSDDLTSKIETLKISIEKVGSFIFSEDENNLGIKAKLLNLFAETEKKYDEIVEYYNETFVGSDSELSTKKEIAQVKEIIQKERKEIKELLASVEKEVINLEDFYIKIFGKEDGKGNFSGGLKDELNTRMKTLEDFEGEQKEKYKALNAEIETLLPGATSAGLASAYKDVKDSFKIPIRNADYTFYISLGVLVVSSLLLSIESIGVSGIKFISYKEWDTVLKGLVYKVPFYAPVLWLAFYASKRRSEYQRLQQEYAHKEALASSYNSYKKQLEALGEEAIALQKELISKTIEAVSYNASATLDGNHGDKMPAQEIIEKTVDAIAKLKALNLK